MAHEQPRQFHASVVAQLDARDRDAIDAVRLALSQPGPATVAPEQFVYFAAFDGTNNKASDLALSGTGQHTNVAQLHVQVLKVLNDHHRLKAGYFPGVGTGGEAGGFVARSTTPTPQIAMAADNAYRAFATEAAAWLATPRPQLRDQVTVAATGFSRGAATAVAFTRLVNDRGVEFEGRMLIPPGLVRVAALLLLDPVYTGIELDLTLPANVTGHATVVRALHEYRYLFVAADYSADTRVRTIEVPGNHGNIGGMYDNGIGARVLEGATGFFQACGVPMADVPPERCFDSSQPVCVYCEGVDRFGNRVWSESGSLHQRSVRLTDGRLNTRKHA